MLRLLLRLQKKQERVQQQLLGSPSPELASPARLGGTGERLGMSPRVAWKPRGRQSPLPGAACAARRRAPAPARARLEHWCQRCQLAGPALLRPSREGPYAQTQHPAAAGGWGCK